jgi:hypothetical protein
LEAVSRNHVSHAHLHSLLCVKGYELKIEESQRH